MTRILLVLCILILASCSRTNLLTYKHRRHYTEKCIITNDTTFSLFQNVCYDKPGVIDEEFCYHLTLAFIDTVAAKTKKILDLQRDTLIVKADYGKYSIWIWSDESKISGQIEIVKWDENEVILKENIQAIDYRSLKIRKFIGTRTFKRKEGK